MKNEVNREHSKSLMVHSGHEEPSLYQVIMHNNDFTPMEFVVQLLEKFFYMNRRAAINLMFQVHTEGSAVCGVFTKDVAETKVAEVIDYAQLNKYPLVCSMEVA